MKNSAIKKSAIKNSWIAATCCVVLSSAIAPATAQPILNRVEKLLRDQLGVDAKLTPASQPGYLGLLGDDSATAGRGVRVLEVYPEHAAAAAGIVAGDLLTDIDGRPVTSMDSLAAELAGKAVGSKLQITVQRDSAAKLEPTTKEFIAILGARPGADTPTEPMPDKGLVTPADTPLGRDGPLLSDGAPRAAMPSQSARQRPRLGVRTIPVTSDVQRQQELPNTEGAQVVSVAVNSAAQRAGIPLGAVITAVDDQAVRTPEELAAAIRGATQPSVRITYAYLSHPKTVSVALSEPSNAPAGPLLGSANSGRDSEGRETRARPPLSTPAPPVPGLSVSELPIPDSVSNAEQAPNSDSVPADAQRVKALEERIRELESRLKALEEKQQVDP